MSGSEPPPPSSAHSPAGDIPIGQPPANPFADDVEIIDAELMPDPPATPGHWRPAPSTYANSPPDITYHVPKRFGISAILGITTALALLFALLRRLGAPEAVYLFFGTLAMVICVAQMRFGDVPRQASVIAGAILCPLFMLGYALFVEGPRRRDELICLLFGCVPLGAMLGYVTGTCAGGIFLLMDLFEKRWTRNSTATRLDAPARHG